MAYVHVPRSDLIVPVPRRLDVPDIDTLPAPIESVAPSGISSTLVEFWNFDGAADLTGQHAGKTVSKVGIGSLASAIGPDGTASSAVQVDGNCLLSRADDNDLDVDGTSYWIAFWIYVPVAAREIEQFYARKGTGWMFQHDDRDDVYFGDDLAPGSIVLVNPNFDQWGFYVGMGDGTNTFASYNAGPPGTGTFTPAGNASAMELLGTGLTGMAAGSRISRLAIGKGAMLSNSEILYLYNNGNGRTYEQLVADAA